MTMTQRTMRRDDGALRITERINSLTQAELEAFGAWQGLRDLSSRTMFEAIDGDPDSVVVEQDGLFEALASVYVTLAYGPSRDEVSMSDEYLITIKGRISAKTVEITNAIVDTSPFYE